MNNLPNSDIKGTSLQNRIIRWTLIKMKIFDVKSSRKKRKIFDCISQQKETASVFMTFAVARNK